MKALRLAMLPALLGICALSVPSGALAEEGTETATAIFAGGCFWCMEPPFDKLDGVHSTISGYIGGSAKDSNYKRVSAGGTGHYEAVRIEYDPSKVTYSELLDVFWRNVDPYDGSGQFCDKGTQYLSAIFALNDEQRELAEASLANVMERDSKFGAVKTEVLPASQFYDAEKYHQDYYMKNPVRYKYYRWGCGRDRRLKQIWGDS